jgi:hypothetical protein
LHILGWWQPSNSRASRWKSQAAWNRFTWSCNFGTHKKLRPHPCFERFMTCQRLSHQSVPPCSLRKYVPVCSARPGWDIQAAFPQCWINPDNHAEVIFALLSCSDKSIGYQVGTASIADDSSIAGHPVHTFSSLEISVAQVLDSSRFTRGVRDFPTWDGWKGFPRTKEEQGTKASYDSYIYIIIYLFY